MLAQVLENPRERSQEFRKASQISGSGNRGALAEVASRWRSLLPGLETRRRMGKTRRTEGQCKTEIKASQGPVREIRE